MLIFRPLIKMHALNSKSVKRPKRKTKWSKGNPDPNAFPLLPSLRGRV
jgi:hypothetical protein